MAMIRYSCVLLIYAVSGCGAAANEGSSSVDDPIVRAINQEDVSRVDSQWDAKRIRKEFGQGQGGELPFLTYPLKNTSEHIAFIFDVNDGYRVVEVWRLDWNISGSCKVLWKKDGR